MIKLITKAIKLSTHCYLITVPKQKQKRGWDRLTKAIIKIENKETNQKGERK